MRPDLEDYDDLNIEETPRSRLMSWLVLGLAVGGFSALAYYAYHAGTEAHTGDEMMVVAADGSPIKEIPANPEGEQFANQDKTIYEVISPNGNSANVEKLLPEPEKPVTDVREALASAPAVAEEKPAVVTAPAPVATPAPAPVVAAAPAVAPAATTYVKKEAEKFVAVAKPVAAPAPKPAAVVKTAEPAPAAPAPLISAKPAAPVAEEVTIPASEPEEDGAPQMVAEAPVAVVEKPAEPKTEPVKETKKEEAKKPASGSYQVQLGAYQSEEEARAAWKKISAKHGSVVSGAPTVVKAELPNGTFYRLRAGAFASSAAAKAACGKMAGQACFPVGK